jgi:hypothetical protein
MSLARTVRDRLGSISDRHSDLTKDLTKEDIEKTLNETVDIVDEALFDPGLRIALEQQYAARRDNMQKQQELLQSPERVSDFIAREKKMLMRLGVSARLSDAFFEFLDLRENFPVELLGACSPVEIYQRLDKLREGLRVARLLHPHMPPHGTKMAERQAAESEVRADYQHPGAHNDPRPSAGAAGSPLPAQAAQAEEPPAQAAQAEEPVVAAAVNGAIGVGLLAANVSGGILLVYVGLVWVAPATAASVMCSNFAFERAYNRLLDRFEPLLTQRVRLLFRGAGGNAPT